MFLSCGSAIMFLNGLMTLPKEKMLLRTWGRERGEMGEGERENKEIEGGKKTMERKKNLISQINK
jgi:hypothetical protein